MKRVRIAGSASVVGAATLLSRIFGLFRDMAILNMFGPSLTDAFYAAFRLPSTLRYLMGEGALSAAFIPVFSDYLRNKSRKEVWELVAAVMVWLLVVSCAAVVIGILCAPWMVRIFLAGFSADPGKAAITTSLARVLFPYLIFVSIMALCMGILNSLGRFAMPSLAQAAFNLIVILFVLLVAPGWGVRGDQQIFAVALGVLCGGVVQVAMQVPVLRREGFSFAAGRIWNHPEIRRIGRLMLPACAGLAVYHVNLLTDNFFASYLAQGSITYLYAANRLIQFPIGTFAIGISTVAFPLMAGCAVTNDMEGLKNAMNYALRLVLFITIPAGAGLIVLGRPIIQLIYERGQFLAAGSTDPTYRAVVFYSMGVWAVGGVSVVVRCFYSLEDMRTPVRIAAFAVLANIVFDLLLMGPLKHGGLALATSLATALNLALLLWILRRKIGRLGLRRVARSLGVVVISTAFMALVVLVAWSYVSQVAPGAGIAAKAERVFLPLAAGLLAYLALSWLLKAPELGEILDEMRRRRSQKEVL